VATPEPYVEVNAHLAQGDIYSLRLVAPLADNEVRILRTESGRHGDYAFSGEPSRIFDHDDLIRTLADLPPDERLLPFSRKGGIPLEYVVVFGDLVDFFMVASQTCDVSGVDGNAPKPFAAIVPVVSLAAYLSRERLPIGRGTHRPFLWTGMGRDLYIYFPTACSLAGGWECTLLLFPDAFCKGSQD